MPQSHESRRDLRYNSFLSVPRLWILNRNVSKIALSRRVYGGSTCKDESHDKRRVGIPVSTILNPFPERKKRKKSCSVDLREVKRTVVHTVGVITGCLSGRTRGGRARLLAGETALRWKVAGLIPSGVSINTRATR